MCDPMQQQLGCLFLTKKQSFPNAKFIIFIPFERCDKTCFKIEKKSLVSVSSVGGKNQ